MGFFDDIGKSISDTFNDATGSIGGALGAGEGAGIGSALMGPIGIALGTWGGAKAGKAVADLANPKPPNPERAPDATSLANSGDRMQADQEEFARRRQGQAANMLYSGGEPMIARQVLLGS